MQSLTALHPQLVSTAQFDPLDPAVVTGWDAPRGWRTVGTTPTRPVFVHQTDIDLNGYVMQDMTFFPQGVGIQDPGMYKFFLQSPAVEGLNLQVLDMVTSNPISDDDLVTLSNRMTSAIAPGMLQSKQDYEQIVMGSYRSFTTDSSFSSLQGTLSLQRSQRFGSGEPTAGRKLYCYRIIEFELEPTLPLPLLPGDQIRIPSSRFIVNGEFVEEPELVNLFRMKRSYELNVVDD